MTDVFRAVLDTNVLVSATLSQNPSSPTRELVARWLQAEFALLTCDDLVDELIETLQARSVAPARIHEQLSNLVALAEWVEVPSTTIELVLPDPDDNVVVACAVVGHATHLVTYDPHFDGLNGDYRGVRILKALPFLWLVRGDTPPAVAPAP